MRKNRPTIKALKEEIQISVTRENGSRVIVARHLPTGYIARDFGGGYIEITRAEWVTKGDVETTRQNTDLVINVYDYESDRRRVSFGPATLKIIFARYLKENWEDIERLGVIDYDMYADWE